MNHLSNNKAMAPLSLYWLFSLFLVCSVLATNNYEVRQGNNGNDSAVQYGSNPQNFEFGQGSTPTPGIGYPFQSGANLYQNFEFGQDSTPTPGIGHPFQFGANLYQNFEFGQDSTPTPGIGHPFQFGANLYQNFEFGQGSTPTPGIGHPFQSGANLNQNFEFSQGSTPTPGIGHPFQSDANLNQRVDVNPNYPVIDEGNRNQFENLVAHYNKLPYNGNPNIYELDRSLSQLSGLRLEVVSFVREILQMSDHDRLGLEEPRRRKGKFITPESKRRLKYAVRKEIKGFENWRRIARRLGVSNWEELEAIYNQMVLEELEADMNGAPSLHPGGGGGGGGNQGPPPPPPNAGGAFRASIVGSA